ncbi:hypothetical protein FB562_2199 [Homoserinimonas aerilata]|uniref:Uncharacterized protein n=1 Tax=Homoserinimonas aerilata TaxID=1162970 RepID=A0A542YF08_9MICO|nr:hypothetical protein [Homoserinimonas aerilata]TQL46675.1 hypothetical protein FB562_2199 [Homoserinimonas aerilata]
MAQRVYATAADYYDFIGDDQPTTTPEGGGDPVPLTEKDLNARLRRASTVVDGIVRFSVYDVDDDNMPTDPDISDAFTEATCAQAAWFDDTDDLTGAESQTGPTRIGSVSFGGSGASGGATNTKSAATSRIAPEAVQILTNAGLITSTVQH